MHDSLGSIFVFMTSALPHSDSGRAVHLLTSSRIVLNKGGLLS